MDEYHQQEAPVDWEEVGPGHRTFADELRRLKRRAKRRPIALIAAAALISGLVVFKQARKKPIYSAYVIMKVEENLLSSERAPTVNRDLRDYAWSIAFSRENLMPIIKEYPKYQQVRDTFGIDMAVSAIKDFATVAIQRNAFAAPNSERVVARSAQMVLGFDDPDPGMAFHMVKRLAALVVRTESVRRRDASMATLEEARGKIHNLRGHYRERQGMLSDLELELARAAEKGNRGEEARLRFEISALRDALETEELWLEAAAGRLSALEVNTSLEERQLGLTFTITEQVEPEEFTGSKTVKLAVLWVMAFMILVPLCAIGIGTFDTRVVDAEDVQRLGFQVVGHVPAFDGDSVGSMKQRGAVGPSRMV